MRRIKISYRISIILFALCLFVGSIASFLIVEDEKQEIIKEGKSFIQVISGHYSHLIEAELRIKERLLKNTADVISSGLEVVTDAANINDLFEANKKSILADYGEDLSENMVNIFLMQKLGYKKYNDFYYLNNSEGKFFSFGEFTFENIINNHKGGYFLGHLNMYLSDDFSGYYMFINNEYLISSDNMGVSFDSFDPNKMATKFRDYQKDQNNKLYSHYSENSNNYVLSLFSPIIVKGQIVGHIRGDFDVGDLFSYYGNNHLTYNYALFDSNGKKLMFINKDFSIGDDSDFKLNKDLLSNNGTHTIIIKGNKYYIYVEVGDSGLKFVTYASEKDMVSIISNMRKKVFATTIMLSLSLGIIILLIIDLLIIRRLKKLSIAAVELQNKNWDVVLPVKTNDEIGDLVNAFDDVRIYMRKLIMGLRDKVKEKEVAELALNDQLMEMRHVEKQMIEYTDRLELARYDAVESKKEADIANKSKSEFLATMSHEIRTPMNGILGMTELLISTRLNSKQLQYANTVMRSAEALLLIINDVLDVSKIEAGELELEHRNFDLRNLIEDIGDLFSAKIADNPVEFIIDYSPEFENSFIGDSLRVRQILSNYVSNAIKFTENGTVSILVDVSDSDFDKHKQVKISVVDTGIGVSQENQKHVFSSFKQADSSMSRKYGGTGLGLSICKELSALMKGSVGIKSDVGKGSSFWFSIPLEVNKSSSKSVSYNDYSGKKVVLIDDVETNGKIVGRILKPCNINYGFSIDAEKAVEYISSKFSDLGGPDLILIDYMMPGVSCDGFAKEIKSKFKNVKLVMLSCLVGGDTNLLVNDELWDGYVQKPIKIKDLYSAIDAVFSDKKDDVDDCVSDGMKEVDCIDPNEFNDDVKILLVEDNKINQCFAIETIKKIGWSYELAENGQEALDKFKNSTYDLVLMDCQMPVMDGFEATKKIRRVEVELNRKRIPIIALTANAMKGDNDKCFSSGMDDFLAKPVRMDDIKSTVIAWMIGTAKSQAHDIVIPEIPIVDSDDIDLFGNDNIIYIDVDAINESKELIGDNFSMVIDVYLSDADKYIEIIKNNIDKIDDDYIRSAHSLKSSSKQIGAEKLSEIAKEIEILSRDYISEGSADMIETIKDKASIIQDIFDKSKLEIKKFL